MPTNSGFDNVLKAELAKRTTTQQPEARSTFLAFRYTRSPSFGGECVAVIKLTSSPDEHVLTKHVCEQIAQNPSAVAYEACVEAISKWPTS